MSSDIKISVFGLGFVGLTTAVGFANQGFRTFGYEINKEKLQMLQNKQIPFYEEGLQDALNKTLNTTLFLSHNPEEVLQDSDIIFYCIGTPMGDDGSADLNYLLQALKTTITHLSKCKTKPILVIKSTVPPSTTQNIFVPFLQSLNIRVNQGDQSDIILINNPEFLREGFAYSDFMNPDRIVIGAPHPLDKIKTIYKPFNAPILFTNLNTAEFIKYLSNTTLAMQISYANEMSMIAQKIGDIDIKYAFKTLHQDKRFSGNPANITSYIYPGLGFGGYCLPKDTLALHKKAQENGFETKILKSILETNEDVLDFYIKKICLEISKDKKIGVLGLSFKPKSDDVRDSKSSILIQSLLKNNYSIIAYDPMANEIFKETYRLPISYAQSANDLLKEADVCIIATAWEEFKNINFSNKILYNLRFI